MAEYTSKNSANSSRVPQDDISAEANSQVESMYSCLYQSKGTFWEVVKGFVDAIKWGASLEA